jgi:hypothetical protein
MLYKLCIYTLAKKLYNQVKTIEYCIHSLGVIQKISIHSYNQYFIHIDL